MKLEFDRKKLKDLMKDFYLLTEMKIAVFDSDYQEILSYPESHCAFCSLMHAHAFSRKQCEESNRNSFSHCQKTAELIIYHCHAGLIEATAPLIDNGVIIGYIMFGQITDVLNSEQITNSLNAILQNYQITHDISDHGIFNITQKTEAQIHAAAKILEACTFYVILKDMIAMHRQQFIENFNTFLLCHLDEDLSIERLLSEFNIPRSKLYEISEKYLGIGIAQHIKKLRMEKAKNLLKETDLSISLISERVGFADYNYFCRTFKSEVGTPAKKYRASSRG